MHETFSEVADSLFLRLLRVIMLGATPVEIQDYGYRPGKQQMCWALVFLATNRSFELLGFWPGNSNRTVN